MTSFQMKSFLLRSSLVMVGAAVLAFGAGCATGSYAYVKKTSDGQRIEMPLKNGAPVNAKQGSIEVIQAGMLPSRDATKKEAVYAFAFRDDLNVVPKSVRVDDVSGEKTLLLVDDQAPKLTKLHWSGLSRGFKVTDSEVEWLTHLDNEMRVYRFTIEQPDGRKVVLYQGWSIPGWLKPVIRQAAGEVPKGAAAEIK